MQIRNNRGEVVGEINNGFTGKGECITTNTIYDRGNPVVQHISIRESDGTVRSTNIIGAKILP